MTPDMYFEKIKEFLESKPASKKLISHLSGKVEIGINVEGRLNCAYFGQDARPVVELRKASSPDVIFNFKPEGLETLLKTSGEDLGDLVVDIIKLYLAGLVKISLPGSTPQLLARGYFGALRTSHEKILQFLKNRGAADLKIFSIISKLKSQK
jgi:hypothetical protein